MKLLTLLKGKIVITLLAGTLLVGGAGAVFAAASAEQQVVQSSAKASPTVHVTATPASQGKGAQKDQNTCPGLPDAQNLATKYQLSTDGKGAALTTICELHEGTFKGQSSNSTTVTASRVYGYGEIDQLLTYAQYLAAHDATNPGGKLNDTNVSRYLAAALHSCGSSPLEVCLKTNIPNYQPGNNNGGNNNGSNNNGKKPTVTPTPHH
jgi:hypothetical protein